MALGCQQHGTDVSQRGPLVVFLQRNIVFLRTLTITILVGQWKRISADN